MVIFNEEVYCFKDESIKKDTMNSEKQCDIDELNLL
jgi:hypothetical protein